MQRSKRVFVAVIAVVVLVALALVFWTTDPLATKRSVEPETDALRTPDAELAHVDLAASAPSEAPSERRSVEAHSVEAASAQAAASVPPATGPFVVRLVYADETWFERRTEVSDSNPFSAYRPRRTGSLHWSDGVDAPAEYAVSDDRVTLPRAPSSTVEFTRVIAADLELRPIMLETVAGSGDREFQLHVEPVPGALLVWAASVPGADRVPVHLALGGMWSPSANVRVGGVAGRTELVRDVQLPHTLPRLAQPTTMWVGSSSWQWRSFVVEPDSVRVEIALERAATVRVLHDEQSDAFVVARAESLRVTKRVPLVVGQATELADLPAAECEVWIEDAKREPLTLVVKVALLAGETREVDLRAATLQSASGGVRVVARGARVVQSLAPLKPTITGDGYGGTESTLALAVFELVDDKGKKTRVVRPSLVETTDDALVYETLGLEPGRHIAVLEPFAAWCAFDVVAGETAVVVLDVGCVGFVRLDVPDEVVSGFSFVAVDAVGSSEGGAHTCEIPPNTAGSYNGDIPLVCGTYRARARDSGNNDLYSEAFVVVAGVTTTVELTIRPTVKVDVAVVDASTGEAVAFDHVFWTKIRIVDAATGASIGRGIRLGDAARAQHRVEWSVIEQAEPVCVSVPDNPQWTFETLEPFVLTDGATITLRVTAK